MATVQELMEQTQLAAIAVRRAERQLKTAQDTLNLRNDALLAAQADLARLRDALNKAFEAVADETP